MENISRGPTRSYHRGFCHYPHRKIDAGRHDCKTTEYKSTDPPLLPLLKVPKREIFVTELFILSDPIWVGDLRTEPKKPFV
jgi:hypothetical protein